MKGDASDCSQCKRLDEILNSETLTKDELISLGAGHLAKREGDLDKDRKINSGNGAYVLVTRNLCPHSAHSVIFYENEHGYYKP